ncbi:macrophage mannose receptor 1-like protein, partial [Lates japonicus]
MDETVFVILLLTGFYIPSASSQNIYQFVKENKTWEEAQDYCIFKMTSVLAPIYNKENITKLMSTPTEGYTDRAWIGLSEELSNWTWMTGEEAVYFNWGT